MVGDRRTLVDSLSKPGIVIVPGAYDAASARLCELLGFECVFATGAGIANSHLGYPDLGLMTVTELLSCVAPMCEATSIPVIVDGDTGFGGVLNVRRTVRDFERIGAAAMTLEDQTFPKRCGHFEGKQVVPLGEMLGRIKAALDGRHDERFLIIARTDARACSCIDVAIERMQAYLEAGADVGFVEAPESVQEVEAVARALRGKPLLINMVEGGKTPLMSAADLEALGYKFMLCANTALRAALKGAWQALSRLRETGQQTASSDIMLSWEERQSLVRLQEFLDLERRLAVANTC